MGDSKTSRALLRVFTALVVVFLFAPIVVMIVFSFNDPAGRQNITWQGFTFENYLDIWSRPQITGPMVTSLAIAAISTVLATTFGTMIALALSRYEFRGRGALNLLIFIPMAAPEIILGASLLTMWISIGVPRGFLTILIAHVMFSISFVVVTVRSRLIGFDRHLEEAAGDLGANGLQTFLRVTLPLIAPGVLAAALLTFALSVDDFVITNFNAGSTITFPLFVWGAARVSVPPQINIIATIIFFVTLAFMLLTVLQQRRAERMASVRPG